MRLFVTLILISCTFLLSAKGPVEYKYFDDGSISYSREVITKNLVRISSYYKNGGIKEIAHYKDDKRHGIWKSFHEDGSTEAIAYFLNDQKTGFWELYSYESNTQHSLVYDSNHLVDYSQKLISAK